MLGKYHIATAAEAIAAAQFARLGCNVAVQYGANQPEYDLVISNGKHQTLPVSVKGNATGSWLLAPRMLENYHTTIDYWLKKHGPRTVYCLVQFKDVSLGQMPQIYLARPAEIATRLKASRGGHGHGALLENRVYKTAKAAGAGTTDRVPDEWLFSEEKLKMLFESQSS